MPPASVDLLHGLLVKDPSKRLGTGPNGAENIMHHKFFGGLNWDDLYHKRLQPPFIADVKVPLDTSNFDPEVASITPSLTRVENGTSRSSQSSLAAFLLISLKWLVLSQAMQDKFRGFSAMGPKA